MVAIQEKKIKVLPISGKAFEKYGKFLDSDSFPCDEVIAYYNAAITTDFQMSPGIGVSVLHIEPREMKAQQFEMHKLSEELFVGFNHDIIIYTVLGREDKPDMDTLAAFSLPAGCAAVIARNVWHFCPLATKPATGFVISAVGTFDHDLYKAEAEKETIIEIEG